MLTTQRRTGENRTDRKETSGARPRTRGFDYLTLDPSPRLRRLREEQEQAAKDPAETIRQAWLRVGAAITEALRIARKSGSARP